MWRCLVWVDDRRIARYWCKRSNGRLTRWRDGWVVWVPVGRWIETVIQLRLDGFIVPDVAARWGTIIPDVGDEHGMSAVDRSADDT